jgi:hypothetical protein
MVAQVAAADFILTTIGRVAVRPLAGYLAKNGGKKFAQQYGPKAFEAVLGTTVGLKAYKETEEYLSEYLNYIDEGGEEGSFVPKGSMPDTDRMKQMDSMMAVPNVNPNINRDNSNEEDNTNSNLILTNENKDSEPPKEEPPEGPNLGKDLATEAASQATKKLLEDKKQNISKQTKDLVPEKPKFGKLTKAEKQTALALKGDKPDFYSRAVEAITNAKQDKTTKGKWNSIIQSNSTKNEMEYLGLKKFLKGNESITRQELLDFVKDKNLVPYIEVNTDTYENTAPKGMADIYKKFSLDGDNKKFTTFQINKEFYNGEVVYKDAHSDTYGDNMFAHARTQIGIGDPEFPSADLGKDAKKITTKLKNTTLVDEIQSPWLQRLQKFGPVSQYNIEDRGDSYAILKNGKVVERIASFDGPPSIEYVQDLIVNRDENERGVKAAPDFPITDSSEWVELVILKLIEEAVKEGRDGIAFSNGQIQYDRYDGMEEKKREGLKKFYISSVTGKVKQIAKKYNLELENIRVDNPDENVFDNDLMSMNTRIKESKDAGYVLKKIDGDLLSSTLDDVRSDIPDFTAVYGKTGKAMGAYNIVNVLDNDGPLEERTTTSEKHPYSYYIWVLDNTPLQRAIDEHNSGNNQYASYQEYFIGTETRPTLTGTVVRPVVKFDMPISIVDTSTDESDMEDFIEATIPSGETIQVSKYDEADTTNYAAYLMNQYIKKRDKALDLQYEDDQRQIIFLKFPKKLRIDALSKPIKLSKLKAQTDRLTA